MCLIINNINGVSVDPAIIENAINLNPDGFGLWNAETNRVHSTLSADEFRDWLEGSPKGVYHFRYATRGKVSAKNCHPFPVGRKGWLFSNGTIDGLGCAKTCDTKVFASLLSHAPKRTWRTIMAMTPTRFALVSKRGEVSIHGKWIEREGVLYSKENCFPENVRPKVSQLDWHYESVYSPDWYNASDSVEKLIGVYGTLKNGEANHGLLDSADYIGEAETVDRYRMTIDNIPYLYSEVDPTGHNISVELYLIRDQRTLDCVDGLEGHPSWYRRRPVEVITEIGELYEAEIYMIDGRAPASASIYSAY